MILSLREQTATKKRRSVSLKKNVHSYPKVAIALAWHRSANWEIPGNAPGSAPANQGALGVLPCSGNAGVLQGVLLRVLNVIFLCVVW